MFRTKLLNSSTQIFKIFLHSCKYSLEIFEFNEIYKYFEIFEYIFTDLLQYFQVFIFFLIPIFQKCMNIFKNSSKLEWFNNFETQYSNSKTMQ